MNKNHKPDPIKVFISGRSSTCEECKEHLGRSAWTHLVKDKWALCLTCAKLDHLVFLASGDTALTRLSKKYSALCAIVLKWSKSRRRYERQGLLVEEAAVHQAEEECLEDKDIRALRRERAALKRDKLNADYIKKFAEQVSSFYPNIPQGKGKIIAEHACRKYSERVGRASSANSPSAHAVKLAVIAHIRHQETNYERIISGSGNRSKARATVQKDVMHILEKWQGGE